MKQIEESFIARNKAKVFEKVEYLVASVGTSYEPIVLNIRLFEPKKILFLHTSESEDTVNRIVEYCNLDRSVYEKRIVSKTNPLDIYQEIKSSYISWGKPKKMYIDFTGGTKAMAAAAAMAGAVVDVQLVYVGSEQYLADSRKPKPGSETLFYIDNPMAVFGDFEIEKAFALFERHNYAGAQEKLEKLKESIPNASICRQMNVAYLLAKVYESWDALNFKEALIYIKELNLQLRKDKEAHGSFLLMDCCAHLEKQEEILNHLSRIPDMIKRELSKDVIRSNDIMYALMFTMYQSARVREEQEKYDMATLLLYRLLEMIGQKRLIHYGLYASYARYDYLKFHKVKDTDYKNLSSQQKQEHFRSRIREIKSELYEREGDDKQQRHNNRQRYNNLQEGDKLQKHISLMEGFIILEALGDPIVRTNSPSGIEKLKMIKLKVSLRNNSIFAHGLGPVSYEDYKEFRDFVLDLFQSFCKIEQVNHQTYADNIKWLSPLDSKNNVVMEVEAQTGIG